MPIVQTLKDHSCARVTMDTLEMELHVKVKLIIITI